MLDVGNIYLTESELEKCREFALVSARSQQAIEFGQRTTKARSVNEIARDNLIGKIAEVAFSKMMKENRCGQCTHITRNPEPRRVTLENQTSSDYDNSPLQFQTHFTLGRKAPTPLEAFRVCVENSDFGGAE